MAKNHPRYVIVGLGRFGLGVSLALLEAEEDVLAIDKNEARVQEVSEQIPHVVAANATDERVLRGLGVTLQDAAIVSCGESLEDSILATAVLHQIGLTNIICKAVTQTHGNILSRVGATRVVYPEREMAERLAHSLINPDLLEHVRLARDHSIVELAVPKFLAGETLVSSNLRANFGVNVLAIRTSEGLRPSEFTIPTPDYKFKRDDHLVILGKDSQIEAVRNYIEKHG